MEGPHFLGTRRVAVYNRAKKEQVLIRFVRLETGLKSGPERGWLTEHVKLRVAAGAGEWVRAV